MCHLRFFFFFVSPSLNLWPKDMSPKPLWPFFHHGELQNSVHHKAYCKGCVIYHLIQANLVEQQEDLDPAAAILAEHT